MREWERRNTPSEPPVTRGILKGDPSLALAKDQLDRIGELLVKIFALERKKLRAYRALWKFYLFDCKRFGIQPKERPKGPM